MFQQKAGSDGRRITMTGLCSLLTFLAGCATPAPAPVPTVSPIYVSLADSGTRLDAASARDLINGYRRNKSLGSVSLDATLMETAANQANAMAAGGDVSKGVRTDVSARLAAAGLKERRARESVSAGYFTISDAFSGWRGPSTHDATLRFAPASRMGIAAVHKAGSRHNIYWALIISD
jgi:uncharacterized protein YkwD